MSTKKRARPSPAADSAQPEIDDAALRKALGDKERAKSKAPFADGACLRGGYGDPEKRRNNRTKAIHTR